MSPKPWLSHAWAMQGLALHRCRAFQQMLFMFRHVAQAMQNTFGQVSITSMYTEGVRPTHFGAVPLPVPVGTQVAHVNSKTCTNGIEWLFCRQIPSQAAFWENVVFAGCSWRGANCHATTAGTALTYSSSFKSSAKLPWSFNLNQYPAEAARSSCDASILSRVCWGLAGFTSWKQTWWGMSYVRP